MKSDMEEQSSMERSHNRRCCRYDNKFSIEPTNRMGDLQAAAHCATIFCSVVDSIYISRGRKKIFLENLFSKQSCKIAA